jgi:carbon-monoxide dehydrogenase large subunit
LRLRAGWIEALATGAWRDIGGDLPTIARIAYLDLLRLPEGMEPGLEAHRAYDRRPWPSSTRCIFARSRSTREPAASKIRRYLILEDCATTSALSYAVASQQASLAKDRTGSRSAIVLSDA